MLHCALMLELKVANNTEQNMKFPIKDTMKTIFAIVIRCSRLRFE